MLQRFASALFGGTVEELSRHGRPEGEKGPEKEDEDWILVNYLGEARTEDLNCQKNDDCWFRVRSKTHAIHQQLR